MSEIVELVLDCGHTKRVVDPMPHSLYLCGRCDTYGYLKYAEPA